jgi:anti-anti-sigma factor
MRFEILPAEGGATRLDLEGRMDSAGCDAIETAFTAVTSAAPGHVLVNMGGVGFIGSLGIRLLIGAARVVRRRGRAMVIYGAQSQPQDVFETVSLADLIPIAADEAAARALLPG